MAFDSRALSIVAYADGFTLWHYRTADPPEALTAPGYFAAAAERLRPGDRIMAGIAAGSLPGMVDLLVTAAAADAAVAVAPLPGRAACPAAPSISGSP